MKKKSRFVRCDLTASFSKKAGRRRGGGFFWRPRRRRRRRRLSPHVDRLEKKKTHGTPVWYRRDARERDAQIHGLVFRAVRWKFRFAHVVSKRVVCNKSERGRRCSVSRILSLPPSLLRGWPNGQVRREGGEMGEVGTVVRRGMNHFGMGTERRSGGAKEEERRRMLSGVSQMRKRRRRKRKRRNPRGKSGPSPSPKKSPSSPSSSFFGE